MRTRALLSLSALAATAVALGVICVRTESREPPGATVSNGRDSIHLSALSYCWGGMCVDGVLSPERAQRITLRSGATLTVRSDGFDADSDISASARPAGRPRARAAQQPLDLARRGHAVTITSVLPAGTYEVYVGFNRQPGGSAGYGFLLDVE